MVIFGYGDKKPYPGNHPGNTRPERGRVTISDAVTLTGANRNTVKKHLAALVDANHLAKHGTGKGTWYAVR